MRFVDRNGRVHEKELSQGFERTTNNRMELLGVIAALEALKSPCDITLYSDSQYVVNAFNQHWVDGWLKRGWKNAQKQPVKNADLWKRLLEAKRPHKVEFVWVKGHAGHPRKTSGATSWPPPPPTGRAVSSMRGSKARGSVAVGRARAVCQKLGMFGARADWKAKGSRAGSSSR